jgi:hypothetical protein
LVKSGESALQVAANGGKANERAVGVCVSVESRCGCGEPSAKSLAGGFEVWIGRTVSWMQVPVKEPIGRMDSAVSGMHERFCGATVLTWRREE